MAHTEGLRDLLADELLARGGKRKGNGTIEFHCPRHADKKASAWLGDHAWGCLACGFSEALRTLADEMGIEPPPNEYTVEDYAAEKAFSVERLREWGLETVPVQGGSAVRIPYLDEGGNLLRGKLRTRGGHMWEGKGSVFLYGLNRLQRDNRPILLVEGESDCHAAWHHDVLALGVPGANAWRSAWKEYLAGRNVFVWQEPDKGGEAFVRAIARDIPSAKVIRANGTKDLADLHKKLGDGFKDELRRMAAAAVPISAPALDVEFDPMLGAQLRKLLEQKLKPIDAVPTPFPTWNRWCRDSGGGKGVARGWHVIAAAASGTGKSVLGGNMAHHAALAGEVVTYITLEMSQSQLQTRQLAIMSGIPIRMLEQGTDFNRSAFEEAVRRIDEIHEKTGGLIRINRRPIRRLQDIIDSIRFNFEVFGSRFFIVDYLQLAWVGRADDLYTKIVEVSHAVNGVVKDLEVAEVGLSQFNRETTKSAQRPTKEGLMGGSSLENDADQVILLHVKEDRPGEFILDAILDKNRHGPKGDIPVRFDKATLRLSEMLPDELPHYEIA